MKCALVLVVLAAALAVAHAQDPEYLYVNYFSTGECTDFRGSKAFINYTVSTLSGASGGSCGVELECLVNPLSRACTRVFSGDVTVVQIAAQENGDFDIYNNFAQTPATHTAHECIKSTVYENCWYRLQRSEQYEEKLQNNCRGRFSNEAILRDDDDSTNTFSYLTYFSDSKCRDGSFEAQRMLTSEAVTLTGAEGSSCAEEMLCLVDFPSVQCQELPQTQSVGVFVEVKKGSRHTDEIEGGDRTKFNSDDCTASSLFPNCYFRYYTADEMETYSDGCDSISGYSGAPSVSLFTTRDDVSAFRGAGWFFSSSPAAALHASLALLVAALALAVM